MDNKKFTSNIENLIDPISVGTVHFLQQFNKLLPKFIQAKMISSSSKKYPFMGFVVEPYCFFLCYEIADEQKAKSYLPDNFEIIKTKIFDNDKARYYCIQSCFRLHTSTFWGARTEFYIIAKDKSTNLLSWIIVDYDSDTISYDKKNGLKSPSVSDSVVTTDYDGNLIVDMKNLSKNREISFIADIKNGTEKELDQRLWLEGNLSIGYGKLLSDNQADIFSLTFSPDEVKKAIEIPLEKITSLKNSWQSDLIKSNPDKALFFPYAQHFLSDSPGYSSKLKNKSDLIKKQESVNFNNIKTFSTKSFKTSFILSSLFSLLITTILIIALILK